MSRWKAPLRAAGNRPVFWMALFLVGRTEGGVRRIEQRRRPVPTPTTHATVVYRRSTSTFLRRGALLRRTLLPLFCALSLLRLPQMVEADSPESSRPFFANPSGGCQTPPYVEQDPMACCALRRHRARTVSPSMHFSFSQRGETDNQSLTEPPAHRADCSSLPQNLYWRPVITVSPPRAQMPPKLRQAGTVESSPPEPACLFLGSPA